MNAEMWARFLSDALQKIDAAVNDISVAVDPSPEFEMQNDLIEYLTQHVAHSSSFVKALLGEAAVDPASMLFNLESLKRTAHAFNETV